MVVDIRIISATSRDLRNEIEVRKFRQELYYRLNTVTINLPPLRDRTSDILISPKSSISIWNNIGNFQIGLSSMFS